MSDDNDETSRDESTGDETRSVRKEQLEERTKDDEEEQEASGMRGYRSEHNPGERVRVARMTDGVESDAEQSASEEGEEETDGEEESAEGERVDVTVRGEGPAEPESDPQVNEESGGETSTGASPEKSSDTPVQPGAETGVDPSEHSAKARAPARPREAADRTAPVDEAETESGPGEVEFDEGTSDVEEFDPGLDLEEDEGSGSATTEDFAALFEDEGVPDKQSYSSGDRVEGEILEIGERFIFVRLDPQTEAAAKRREFEDEEGEVELEIGDRAEFYVTYADEDEVQLGRQLEGDEGSIDVIREAKQNGVPVEGKVTGTNKGGFEVKVHGVEAFCPISAIELGFTEEKEVHVGATYRFKVDEVRDGGDTIVLNRADLLQKERAEKARETLESLEEGDVVEGVVTRTTQFGAFVDLGGVEGLVHISELSHRHFDHPDDVVDEGEQLEVEILELEEPDEEGDQPRISLSRQAVERDPWEVVNEQFAVGEQVEGEVVRNAPFGSFIEIAPGVEGLCHVSEMSWTEHVRTPDDVVEPGDVVTVEVQDIDLANKRVSLSIREAEGDPWDDVADTYSVGMEVEGSVENIEDFGAFVQLPTGITALIPRSEMNLPSGVTPHRKFNRGEYVTAEIINIDSAERKMALSPRSSGETDEEAGKSHTGESDEGEPEEVATAAVDASSSSDESFGTLGDMIGDELQDED